MDYQKRLVIFIDILGTKNYEINELYRINKIFRKELITTDLKGSFIKYVSSFYDCAYIVYEYSQVWSDINNLAGNNEIEKAIIIGSLVDIAQTISVFIANGFLCRGGISYGDVYLEKENNILFGPAVNKAYQLEQDAIMPRIIIDDDIVKYLLTQKIQLNISLPEKNEIMETDIKKNLILEDSYDKQFYLNCLFGFSYEDNLNLGEKEYQFNEIYSKNKKISNNVINLSKDHKIIAKHLWYLKYFDTVKNIIDVTRKTLIKKKRIDSKLKSYTKVDKIFNFVLPHT